MYAGHFAAGLALRGRARRVPVAAFVIGAFVLDLLWIAFGVLHVDHTPWDDWSHSLLMAVIWGAIFAAFFRRSGPMAVLAIWLAVVSHYILDLIVQGASLYPSAPRSQLIPILVTTYARPLQLGLCVLLLSIFIIDERKAGQLDWRTWAVVVLVLALNARFLTGL